MRTVLVHLRGPSRTQVAALLTKTFAPIGTHWTHKSCLYIDFYDDLESECEDGELAEIHDALGGAPTVSVSADVSGRQTFEVEAREFAIFLLSAFQSGVAQDDYSGHCWTLDEIRRNHRVSGFTFFDPEAASREA